MRDIVAFSEKEEEIMNRVKAVMEVKGDLYGKSLVKNHETALIDLTRAISQYPRILGEQWFGSASRSIETLVDNLSIEENTDLVLHLPSKAVLGQAFTIAKMNFFFMLLYLAGEITELGNYEYPILETITICIFTIMAEEVFLAIISDRYMPLHIRTNAAFLLANIWEYRVNHGVKEFVPILNSIWTARKKMKPAYGTMLGISEIISVSEGFDPLWLDYIASDEFDDAELSSLQEFIMGLSYEEMIFLADEMKKRKMTLLTENDVLTILAGKREYPGYNPNDPREFYRSFRHRKRNALLRIGTGREGPKKTIEEYIMCYLLARPERWGNM